MLKGIPEIISPKLMKCMMEMGHGDVLLIADANYPAKSNAQRYLRLDGVETSDLLDAILRYYPLDIYVDEPVKLMQPLPEEPIPEIWNKYEDIITKHDSEHAFRGFGFIDRLSFYEESQKAYLIVQTNTIARYANIMLKKGVI